MAKRFLTPAPTCRSMKLSPTNVFDSDFRRIQKVVDRKSKTTPD